MTGDDELVDALKRDWRSARITERERAMLHYTEKLTKRPSELAAADVEELRRHGLGDEEVLALVMLAGFFHLATRVADALGVELDPELTRGTAEYKRIFERTAARGEQ